MEFKESVKQLFELLINTNPEFAEYVKKNENKSSDEIFKENNIEFRSYLDL